jgi:Fic/DOC family
VSQDAVVLHCQTVKRLDWASLADGWPSSAGCLDSVPSVQTLHEAYVDRFDAFRDSERAARIRAAIQLVAERARAGAEVTWEGLCSIQCVVLDRESVGFRAGPAYANARMETYGSHPRFEDALARKITKDDAEELHPLLKACRLYLDVRFFHPFADGNSAAARLAFQWVLQRDGVRLPELTPLFRLPISPGDQGHYQALLDSAGCLLRQATGAG